MASRVVDRKIRHFNTEWVEKFFFHEVENKAVCLICSKTIAVNKQSNLARHYNTNHTDYDGRYPIGTARRKEQLQRLLCQVQGQMDMMKSATSIQKRCTAASYKVAHILGKAMAPYRHSETVKECMVSTVKTLFPDQKDILEAIQGVQLSRKSCTNRIEDIAEWLTHKVVNDLKECNSFSIALDDSTAIDDVAQLCVFVRYYADNQFQEEFLSLIPLTSRTTGEDIYKGFKTFMDTHNIPIDKIIGVATDGAPAMVGRHSGFVKRLGDINPAIVAFHCIIHETVLCAKLKDDYNDLMVNTMKLINYLKAKSALRHRQLRAFLQERDADYDELLTHNNVRWLSKGRALGRVWLLRNELMVFLSEIDTQEAKTFLELLQSEEKMADMAFLVDFLKYMNDLNVKLQGNGRDVTHLWQTVSAFHRKLEVFRNDIVSDMDHFPTLKNFVRTLDSPDIADLIKPQAFIGDVIDDMNQRFAAFKNLNLLINLIAYPNDMDNTQWKQQLRDFMVDITPASLELELCEFLADLNTTEQSRMQVPSFF